MTHDLDALMRAADPAHDVEGYDDEQVRVRASAAIARSSQDAAVVDAAPARTPVLGRTWVRVGIAAAVACAVLIGPVLSLRSPGGASPAAASALYDAASIVAVDPPARPDQWYRLTTRATWLASYGGGAEAFSTYLVPVEITRWTAVDGSRPGWVTQVEGKGTRLAGPDVRTPGSYGSFLQTVAPEPDGLVGSWGSPSRSFLAELPRDVDSLRDRLYDDSASGGQSRDGEAFVHVADLLRTGRAPADLRSSLYKVLATIPGVEVTAADVEVGGWRGIAIGRLEEVDGRRSEIVVDPRNGQFVGEREIATRGFEGVPVGTVIGTSSVSLAVVDDVPPSVRAATSSEGCVPIPGDLVECPWPQD